MKRLMICLLFLMQMIGTGCSHELQKINGRVSVGGSEPHTYLRLVDKTQQEYRLVGDKIELLRRDWQGRNVELRGRIIKKAIGPGMPAEFNVEAIQQ